MLTFSPHNPSLDSADQQAVVSSQQSSTRQPWLLTPREGIPASPRGGLASTTTSTTASQPQPLVREGIKAGQQQGIQQKTMVKFRIPAIEIKFTREKDNEEEEVFRVHVIEINADMFMGPTKEYYYLFVQNMQIDNMFPSAEYPVLLAMDRRKLHGYDANLLEILGISTSLFPLLYLYPSHIVRFSLSILQLKHRYVIASNR